MELDIKVSEFDSSNKRRVAKVKEFLDKNELDMSPDIELFVTLKDNDEMIACGGLAGKVLKCIAVDSSRRGEGVILKVVTHLLMQLTIEEEENFFSLVLLKI